MATPAPFDGSPGSVNLDQATLGLVVHAATKIDTKLIWARCRYNGSAWEVHSSTDSNEIISGNLVWSTNKLTIALSGYTAAPVAVATPHSTTGIHPLIDVTSSSNIDMTFFGYDGVQVTTEATTMDFYLMVVGI